MSKISEYFVSVCNYISAAIMAVIVALQFVPFWKYDGGSNSISSYIWFPEDKGTLQTYLRGQVGQDFKVDDIVMPMVCMLLFAIAGIIVCLLKGESPLASLLPLISGGFGLWGYLGKSAMQMGTNWQLHAVCCGLLAVIEILSLGVGYYQHRKEKQASKRLQQAVRI